MKELQLPNKKSTYLKKLSFKENQNKANQQTGFYMIGTLAVKGLKSSLFFKKNTIFTGKELLRILSLKNAKFSGYCFDMNPNIHMKFSNLH